VVDAGTICDNRPIEINPVGVNVMLAVDGSKAMSAHWETMQLAAPPTSWSSSAARRRSWCGTER
jgi:hypothetical protein